MHDKLLVTANGTLRLANRVICMHIVSRGPVPITNSTLYHSPSSVSFRIGKNFVYLQRDCTSLITMSNEGDPDSWGAELRPIQVHDVVKTFCPDQFQKA
jgi:hypothetical protein